MKDDTVLVLVLGVLLIGDVIAVCFAIWFLFHGQVPSTIASVAIALLLEKFKTHLAEEAEKAKLRSQPKSGNA